MYEIRNGYNWPLVRSGQSYYFTPSIAPVRFLTQEEADKVAEEMRSQVISDPHKIVVVPVA